MEEKDARAVVDQLEAGAAQSPKLSLGFYPGSISRIPVDAHYPGTKTVFFWTVGAYNRFFQEKPGEPAKPFVVVEAIPTPYFFGLLVGITCTYTKQLTPEEEDDLNFVQRVTEVELQKRRMERALAREEEREVQSRAQAEQARLAMVGKKYEDHHAWAKARPTLTDQTKALASLKSGDPEVLFATKEEAYGAGFMNGRKSAQEGDK